VFFLIFESQREKEREGGTGGGKMVDNLSSSMLIIFLVACLVPGVPGGTLGTRAGPGNTPPPIEHEWARSRSQSAAGTRGGSRIGGSIHQDSKAGNEWSDFWEDSGSGREEGVGDEDEDEDEDEEEEERNGLAFASPVRSVRGKTEVINLPEALKAGKVKSTVGSRFDQSLSETLSCKCVSPSKTAM
jgi:hypothetical protein